MLQLLPNAPNRYRFGRVKVPELQLIFRYADRAAIYERFTTGTHHVASAVGFTIDVDADDDGTRQ
jgi:hypothetical protein